METISHVTLTFLLNAVWQIPVVAAVAVLAAWLLRDNPATHRHALYVAALIVALGLPLASIPNSSEPSRATYMLPAPALDSPAAASQTSRSPALSQSQPRHQRRLSLSITNMTVGVLLGAYLAFVLFRIACLFAAFVRTVQIRRTASPASPSDALQSVWDEARQVFGIAGVQLLKSEHVEAPVMVGLWRRAIILPTRLLAGSSTDVLTSAIGHEMAHIARHDFAANLLYQILYIPIALHPAAWVIRREIDRTRELACDELVTQRLLSPRAYAKAIVSIAAFMTALRRPGFTLGVFDGDALEHRIRRLLDGRVRNPKRGRWLLATGLVTLLISTVLLSSLAINARAQSPAQPEIRLGTEAYNSGDFDNAIQHYRRAVDLDAANLNAKLFLANTYLRQGEMPGADDALALYEQVLNRDPQNETAIFGLASSAGLDRWPQAHDLMLKVVAADPKNKNVYYAMGVLDWKIAYQHIQQARMAAGIPLHSYEVPDPALRQSLREQNLPHIQEGYKMLETALRIDPDWFEALVYMNLILRLDAAVVDNPADAQNLTAKADAYVQKALAIKQSISSEGPMLDPNAPPPPALPAPPPPPPPPPPSAPPPPPPPR